MKIETIGLNRAGLRSVASAEGRREVAGAMLVTSSTGSHGLDINRRALKPCDGRLRAVHGGRDGRLLALALPFGQHAELLATSRRCFDHCGSPG
jgi:hypothetical protein